MTKQTFHRAFTMLTTCRMCGGANLMPAVTLPDTPLANEFHVSAEAAKKQAIFPLTVNVCEDCDHAQLSVAVKPERLFAEYLYESKPNMDAHFKEASAHLIEALALEPESPYTPGDLVVEFGSNDGSYLKYFSGHGMRCVGVEPGKTLAQKANSQYSFETHNEFFTLPLAQKIRQEHGAARVILANNVMAHIKDWDGVLLAVDALLAKDGTFVFEVQDRAALQRHCLFDMIYHEHLDYHDGGVALRLAGKFAQLFRVASIEKIATHGGSLRIYARRQPGTSARFEVARKPNNLVPWFKLSRDIAVLASKVREVVNEEWKGPATLCAYGAPAKYTTMAYTLGLPLMNFVVDDSALKRGRFTPGRGEPIVGSARLTQECVKGPVLCFIAAWNFADAIIEKVTVACVAAKVAPPTFIVPLPELRVVGPLPVLPLPASPLP